MDKKNKFKDFDTNLLQEETELEIIKQLSKYPETIIKAGDNYDPSEIAKYLYELARLLNDYYHQISIINSEEKTKNSRLSLLAAIAQILKNGFGLLGIETIEEM